MQPPQPKAKNPFTRPLQGKAVPDKKKKRQAPSFETKNQKKKRAFLATLSPKSLALYKRKRNISRANRRKNALPKQHSEGSEG